MPCPVKALCHALRELYEITSSQQYLVTKKYLVTHSPATLFYILFACLIFILKLISLCLEIAHLLLIFLICRVYSPSFSISHHHLAFIGSILLINQPILFFKSLSLRHQVIFKMCQFSLISFIYSLLSFNHAFTCSREERRNKVICHLSTLAYFIDNTK